MSSTLDSVQGMTVRAIMRLPKSVLSALAGPQVTTNGEPMDLQTQVLFRLLNASGRPRTEELSIEQARIELLKLARSVGITGSHEVSAVDQSFEGPAGPVPIRIYRPRTVPETAPIIVYYHGGGWAIGDLDSHDGICRMMTEKIGCITISVDYRLAPEHRFPAAVEDSVAAFEWAVANARKLGGNSARIAVAGDSAGGNLAAVVSQLAKAKGGQSPCAQALFYPSVDLSTETASHAECAEFAPLYLSTMRWFRVQYFGDWSDPADTRCSPLRAESFDGLAPAYIATAGFDVLRDEAFAYAAKLSEAGVTVVHRHHPGLAHGYNYLGDVIAASAEAYDSDLAAIKRLIG